jgi:hypothetical protein
VPILGSASRLPGAAATRMKQAHRLGLIAAFAAEFALFYVTTLRHYAWIYPRWWDQLQYLEEAYRGYSRAQHSGFVRGICQTFAQGSPQGTLHGFLALLTFKLLGPSRIAVLSLNLLAFLALQTGTFIAARRASNSWPIAWAAIALLAALRLPWSDGSGSIIDFRLDWMAACAYGVALAAAIGGDGFRSIRWMPFLGVAVGTAILIRYLTAIYFGFILLLLFAWLLTRPDRRARCGHLSLAALVALSLAGPALWHSRRAIYAYYWTQPLKGPEGALYVSHLGVMVKAKWIVGDLLINKIGVAALILGLGVAVALLLIRTRPGVNATSSACSRFSLGSAGAVALAFLFTPAAVLAFYPEKVSQTLSILIPGAFWIIVLAWVFLARRVAPPVVAAIGGVAVVAGALLFASSEIKKAETAQTEEDFRKINALSDYLYYRAEESGLEQPSVAVTWNLDGLNAGAFQVLGFERHHRFLPLIPVLPTGLFATTRDTVMHGLANSDFVCLIDKAVANWPYDREMNELLPEMRGWCDANLKLVGHLKVDEFSASVYEQPGLGAPTGGGGVNLDAMIAAASRAPPSCEAIPPAKPIFSQLRALGSTRDAFRWPLLAAYTPCKFEADALPNGLHLDSQTGELQGRFLRAGEYVARITATNALGSTAADLAIHVEDQAIFSVLSAPKVCSIGAPAQIFCGAYDAADTLDFIDITDLTDKMMLRRIPVPSDRKRSWEGVCQLQFGHPGPHNLLVRTVCYDPEGKGKYSFVDRICEIEILPVSTTSGSRSP